MSFKKVIPCLDIKNGRVVKGIEFVKLRDAGDPAEIAKRYNEAGADEIVFLDITATNEDRGNTVVDLLKRTKKDIKVPLAIGGGIRVIEDVQKMLDAGFVINFTGGNTLRFCPPLIIEKKHIDLLCNALDNVLRQI